jgi:MinD superfamily P-loop ATPase
MNDEQPIEWLCDSCGQYARFRETLTVKHNSSGLVDTLCNGCWSYIVACAAAEILRGIAEPEST